MTLYPYLLYSLNNIDVHGTCINTATNSLYGHTNHMNKLTILVGHGMTWWHGWHGKSHYLRSLKNGKIISATGQLFGYDKLQCHNLDKVAQVFNTYLALSWKHTWLNILGGKYLLSPK